jgi:hypothetical protein
VPAGRVPPQPARPDPTPSRASDADLFGAAGITYRPHAARVRAVATMADARQWAFELGLGGQLGDRVDDSAAWDAPPSCEERALAASLQAEAEDRALTSNSASYVGKMRTMLHWLAIYRDAQPNAVLFRPLGGPDHRSAAIHNEDTRSRLAIFMRRHGSIAAGRRELNVSEGGIAAVVSTMTAYAALSSRYRVRDHDVNELLPRVQRNLRREDGPSGSRQLMRGIEPHHVAAADATGRYDRSSADGVILHCCATTLISVIGRGGEPGLVEGKPQRSFRPETGVTWADITFASESECRSLNDGIPFLRFLWFPIKDGDVRRKKVPIVISRIHTGAVGADPRCAYDAITVAYRSRVHLVPAADRASTAFFTLPNGKIIDTSHVRERARVIASLSGIDPAEVGAKSFRIGGAFKFREWCDRQGLDASRLLKERGRWWSDIGYIYARMSERVHLAGSRGMTEGDVSTAAETYTAWTQPAR